MPKRSRATLKPEVLTKLVIDINKGSPAEERDLIIIEWLLAGDPEPFIAWAGEGVGPDVLQLIARMLAGDADLPYRLAIHRQPGQRGPPNPSSTVQFTK